MVQDEAIKYNALYQEVKLAINNISNLGFDTSEYQNRLKEINHMVQDEVVNYVKGMAEASYILTYSQGMTELNKLKYSLDRYNIYAKVKNTCDYINLKITDNISLEELDELVNKLVEVVRSIRNSNTTDYDNEKQIVDGVFETVYEVIKLEIMMTGESKLFLYVQDDKANISYFNNIITNDIGRINLQDNKNKKLKLKLGELGQKGIYSNYLDLELIKLIVVSQGNEDLKEIIANNINRIICEIDDSEEKLKKINLDVDGEDKDKKKMLDILKNKRKKLGMKITSLALTFSLVTGGGILINRWTNKIASNAYEGTIQTYSSKDGKVSSKNDILFGNGEDSNLAQIEINYKNGDNAIHNINEVQFDDPMEYYNYLVENNLYLTEEELDKIDYFEIKTTDYEKTENAYKVTKFRGRLVLYGLYLILLMGFLETYLETAGCIDTLGGIISDLLDEKATLKETEKKILELHNALSKELNNNASLRVEFNRVYNENKYLLDNPEELYNKINNLKDLETKEKIRKYVRDR